MEFNETPNFSIVNSIGNSLAHIINPDRHFVAVFNADDMYLLLDPTNLQTVKYLLLELNPVGNAKEHLIEHFSKVSEEDWEDVETNLGGDDFIVIFDMDGEALSVMHFEEFTYGINKKRG
jgi:hypothetical protein